MRARRLRQGDDQRVDLRLAATKSFSNIVKITYDCDYRQARHWATVTPMVSSNPVLASARSTCVVRTIGAKEVGRVPSP
jgi:hypothetical protein